LIAVVKSVGLDLYLGTGTAHAPVVWMRLGEALFWFLFRCVRYRHWKLKKSLKVKGSFSWDIFQKLWQCPQY